MLEKKSAVLDTQLGPCALGTSRLCEEAKPSRKPGPSELQPEPERLELETSRPEVPLNGVDYSVGALQVMETMRWVHTTCQVQGYLVRANPDGCAHTYIEVPYFTFTSQLASSTRFPLLWVCILPEKHL